MGQIGVSYDEDVSCTTLEPQLVKANGLQLVDQILGKSYSTEDELLKHMRDNKTEFALKFFETKTAWNVPEYISYAVY